MTLLIGGYFGFDNEGDELILEALAAAWPDLAPRMRVLSADPPATFRRHRLQAVNRWSPWTIGSALTSCDALIFGGGGLLQDLSGPFTPAYYLGLLAAAKFFRKPVLLLGQGFGPVSARLNQALCRRVLPRADFIMARDPSGLAWCQSLGVAPERLTLGADLIFGLPSRRAESGPLWVACPRADQERTAGWLEALRRAAGTRGRKLRVVALGNRGDWDRTADLRSATAWADCEFAEARRLPAAAAERLFAGAELVVSQRYHGLVLGARAGAAVTGLGPDPKIANLLADLGQLPLAEKTFENSLQSICGQVKELQEKAWTRAGALRQRALAGLAAARQRLGM